jgi:putative endonuclease
MPVTVYIVQCADNSLYTGCAKDLKKRIEEHNVGKKGAKYTRSRRPVRLVYSEQKRTLGAALTREAQIKRLTRREKLKLINS